MRFQSNIGQEVLKGKPSFANGNSSTSVSPIRGIFRIAATSFHMAPNRIFSSARLRMAVTFATFTESFALKTPARSCMSFPQVGDVAICDGSTVAKTHPLPANALNYRQSLNRYKSAKSLTGQIGKWASSRFGHRYIVSSSKGKTMKNTLKLL